MLCIEKIDGACDWESLSVVFIAISRLVIINFNGAENLWVTRTISRL